MTWEKRHSNSEGNTYPRGCSSLMALANGNSCRKISRTLDGGNSTAVEISSQ